MQQQLPCLLFQLLHLLHGPERLPGGLRPGEVFRGVLTWQKDPAQKPFVFKTSSDICMISNTCSSILISFKNLHNVKTPKHSSSLFAFPFLGIIWSEDPKNSTPQNFLLAPQKNTPKHFCFGRDKHKAIPQSSIFLFYQHQKAKTWVVAKTPKRYTLPPRFFSFQLLPTTFPAAAAA